ncbi:MAG: DUF2066 domain-containing protein [Alphaproteobacteria bacterium]|jgi:hypothetical protein|nr:DUF2066 domain-containing protein [Alphaproteobacteria bacterium]
MLLMLVLAAVLAPILAPPAAAQTLSPGTSTFETPGTVPGGLTPAVPPTATVQQTPGAWVVGGVRVDVTGSSTAAARDQAFAEGRRQAFGALIDHLGVPRSALDPGSLSDRELSRLTRGFSVEEERTTPGRYIASLSYIFRPDAVRSVLAEREITTLEGAGPDTASAGAVPGSVPDGTAASGDGRPVLVLPVLRQGGTARLWDSPNPWREAWQNVDGGDRFVVPFGDLQDVGDVDVEAATRGDTAAFRAIAERYGAGDTVVAVAQPNGEAVSVSLTRYSGSGPGETRIADTSATSWSGAVQEAIGRLDDPGTGTAPGLGEAAPAVTGYGTGTPIGTLPGGGGVDAGGLAVRVPLSGGGDWFDIRRRLALVGSLTGVRILSLGTDEAVLRLGYIGSESQLRSALAAQGLSLTQGAAAPELRRGGG